MSFDFTPNNPTGFHKIDLSDSAQRDICLRLVEIKNEMVARELQFREFYSKNKRAGGVRDDSSKSTDFERVWRNGKLDQATFVFYDGWKVPKSGFLEVDFVALTKPDLPPPSQEQEFQKFFDSLKSQDITERQKSSWTKQMPAKQRKTKEFQQKGNKKVILWLNAKDKMLTIDVTWQ